jgi:hypothetical protein
MTALNFIFNDPKKVFALESPLTRVEGGSETFVCTIVGGSALTSAAAVAYRNKILVTTTVFPAGSVSVSGNTITLKPLTATVGRATYTVVITATYTSGQIGTYKFDVIVQKALQKG